MIIVDVETTGVNPSQHAIVGIGAIEFAQPDNQFYIEPRVDEATKVNPQAMEINGLTLEEIKDPKKPSQAEAAQQFLDWAAPVTDKTLAGHNTYFDAGFLRKAVSLLKKTPDDYKWPFGRRYIDLHSLAYTELMRRGLQIPQKYGLSGLWSGAIYELLGMPLEPEPHNALVGAKWEAEAISRLIHSKNLLPEFKQHPLPSYLSE